MERLLGMHHAKQKLIIIITVVDTFSASFSCCGKEHDQKQLGRERVYLSTYV